MMMINELFKAIGIPMTVRNLMVDYCDGEGNFYHKPLQTVSPREYTESDMVLTGRIKDEVEKQGFTVCGIQEVYGDFGMEELEAVFNSSQYGKYPTRVIFIDMEKAMK